MEKCVTVIELISIYLLLRKQEVYLVVEEQCDVTIIQGSSILERVSLMQHKVTDNTTTDRSEHEKDLLYSLL